MLNKDRFIEIVNDNEEMILPGDIKVRKVIPSREELEALDKDMDRYSIRVRNTYKTSKIPTGRNSNRRRNIIDYKNIIC